MDEAERKRSIKEKLGDGWDEFRNLNKYERERINNVSGMYKTPKVDPTEKAWDVREKKRQRKGSTAG